MEEETKTTKVEKVGTPQPEGEIDKKSVVEKQPMMKKLPMKNNKETIMLIIASFVVVLAGIGTGWLFSGQASAEKSSNVSPAAQMNENKDETEAGIADEETFRDSAEGKLVEGGIDGEGTHHLERNLGPEKDVYLTSTVINLQNFVDKNVMVWGETISAQNAGWLMDVGKIKVTE